MHTQAAAVQVTALCFQIHSTQILKNVSMQVPTGGIYALVGNNGAGKTTLLKLLLGMETAYKGEIQLFGSRNLLSERRQIGTVMSLLSCKPSLHGRAYLYEMCLLCGANPRNAIPRAAAMTECTSYLNKRLQNCSDGMRQRIMIAGALVGNPQLLILDEPFNAIDPYGMEKLRILLDSLHRQGVTILVTSHILSELAKLATEFGVIYEGQMCCTASRQELLMQGFSRYLYQTGSLAEGVHVLETQYPALCGIPYYDDSIAVIARNRPELPEQFRFLRQEPAAIEEILRFYMNGKGLAA